MRKHFPLDPSTGIENAALLPWTNGVPSTGTEGSYPPFALCTDVEAEILNAQAAAGLSASTTDTTQLAQAMSTGLFLGTFGGTANALTAALAGSVNIPALVPGMRLHGLIGASANTGATTLSISGFATNAGVKPARKSDGVTELGSGDLKPGGIATWFWDGAAFRLTGLVSSDLLAAVPSANIQVITASGNYVPTPGARKAIVFAQAGGGSGGSGSTGSSVAAGGGGPGGMAIAITSLVGVTSIPCTIGLGGAANTGNNGVAGNTGGTTTFGPTGSPIAQATGGTGGTAQNAAAGVLGQSGVGTVGLLLLSGSPGSVNTGGNQAGSGGAAPMFGGAGLSGVGVNAALPGKNGGGGGGGSVAAVGPVVGAAGGNGLILVMEFA